MWSDTPIYSLVFKDKLVIACSPKYIVSAFTYVKKITGVYIMAGHFIFTAIWLNKTKSLPLKTVVYVSNTIFSFSFL